MHIQTHAEKNPASSRVLSAPRTVLGLLCLLYLTLFVVRVAISGVAPLIRTDLRLSNTELGLVFSAFAIPYAVFQLIGGWIGDKWGARMVLCVSCGVVALATALTGLVGGFGTLFAARLTLGFGEGATFPTATRAMASWIPENRWGFAQGITHSFSRIGNAIAAPLVAWTAVLITWRGSFVAMGVASTIWVLLWGWFFRNDPREHPAITDTDLAELPKPSGKKRPAIPWLELGRRILPVTAVDFCYGWILWLFLSWIPGFFFENYHLNLQSSAMYSAGVLSAGIIGDTAGGMISDWLLHKTGSLVVARRTVMIVGFLGAFAFMMPVILVHNLTLAAVSLSLAFLFAELIVGPIWAVPMDIAPRYAGTASGMMNFGFAFAGIVSPSTFGYLIDHTGSWVVPFAASVGLLIVGALLASRLRPDIPFEAPAGAGTAQ
ncbi:MAG TPA: MFS transporter [Candidatus Acidoferrales bacterium]|nr:MFS transporter [Candidatus Acidoferrales bacterium]